MITVTLSWADFWVLLGAWIGGAWLRGFVAELIDIWRRRRRNNAR